MGSSEKQPITINIVQGMHGARLLYRMPIRAGHLYPVHFCIVPATPPSYSAVHRPAILPSQI